MRTSVAIFGVVTMVATVVLLQWSASLDTPAANASQAVEPPLLPAVSAPDGWLPRDAHETVGTEPHAVAPETPRPRIERSTAVGD